MLDPALQRPSIGHIVLVRHSQVLSNGTNIAPAIVTRVLATGLVNLTAWPDLGLEKHLEVVPHVDLTSDEEGWFWPPRV
jgi:hypothetical protein